MCTLFILEDNTIDQYIFKTNLENDKVFEEIIYYDNGKPLINYLDTHKDNDARLPDMLFVDLEMPGVNGWKVLEKLKSLYESSCKEMVVYIVTVSISLKDIIRAKSYPFVREFISKPITPGNYKAIRATANTIRDEN